MIAWEQNATQVNLHPEQQVEQVISGSQNLSTASATSNTVRKSKSGSTVRRNSRLDIPIYILHLIAHGVIGSDGVGRLLFPSSSSMIEKDMTPLREAVEAHSRKHDGAIPAIAVLNACLSAAAGGITVQHSAAYMLKQAGIPYVVAHQAAVKVFELLTFNQAFYSAIASGTNVLDAMQMARRDLAEQGDQPVERTLAPTLQGCPRLMIIDDGIPGWAVPVLYMSDTSDGSLPGIILDQHIVWPTDGKVMVLVQIRGQRPFYIDETPVTVNQFNMTSGGAGATPPLLHDVLGTARAQDDGMPKCSVTPADGEYYAQQVGKRLPTFAQWRILATLDSDYDTDGLYLGANAKKIANVGGNGVNTVRVRCFAPSRHLGLYRQHA